MKKEIKDLLSDPEIQEIINQVKEPKDGKTAFFVVTALIQKNQMQKAMDAAKRFRKLLWNENPLKCLSLNFELRFTLKQFDEAYEDLDFFENTDYISQEVEEAIKEARKSIRIAEREAIVTGSEVNISSIKNDLLNKTNDLEVLSSLSYITSHNPENYEPELMVLAQDEKRHCMIRAYSLFCLVLIKCKKQIDYKKEGQTISLVPAKIKPPFVSQKFQSLLKSVSKFTKDIAILQTVGTIISDYQLIIYPDLVEDLNPELLVAAAVSLASDYLSAGINKLSLLRDSFTLKELDEMVIKIEAAQTSIPTFSNK